MDGEFVHRITAVFFFPGFFKAKAVVAAVFSRRCCCCAVAARTAATDLDAVGPCACGGDALFTGATTAAGDCSSFAVEDEDKDDEDDEDEDPSGGGTTDRNRAARPLPMGPSLRMPPGRSEGFVVNMNSLAPKL